MARVNNIVCRGSGTSSSAGRLGRLLAHIISLCFNFCLNSFISSIPADHAMVHVDFCPKCKSEDLAINTRKKRALCENCGNAFSYKVKTGLEDVVRYVSLM